MKKKIFYYGFSLLSIWLSAQVKVRVFDVKNNPISQAQIKYNNQTFSTDAKGHVQLPEMVFPVKLKISHLNHERLDTTLIKPTKYLSFSLKPSSNNQLKEIVVLGERAFDKYPVSVSNLSKKVVEKENLGSDIPVLLNNQVSVVSSSDAGGGIGGANMRIRGSDGTRINVTVNGVPINDSESHDVFWVNMPDLASSAEKIQIQRGVGTSTNGSAAFGASLNISTAAPIKKNKIRVANSLGSFNTHKHTLQSDIPLNKHWGARLRLSKINSDGYVERATSDLVSYYAEAVYSKDHHQLNILGFGGKEITYHAWNGVDEETYKTNRRYNPSGEIFDKNGKVIRFYDKQTDNYAQQHLQLHYNSTLNDHWQAHQALFFTYGEGHYKEYKQNQDLFKFRVPGALKGEKNDLVRAKWLQNYMYGLLSNWTFKNDKITWETGLNVMRYTGSHFGRVIDLVDKPMPKNIVEYYKNRSYKYEASGFTKLTYEILPKLFAFVDGQLRHINYKGIVLPGGADLGKKEDLTFKENWLFFNPKAGVTYRPDKNHKFYGSYAVSHREPNRADIKDGIRNNKGKIPKPEQLQDLELGYGFQNNRFGFSVNGYAMFYKDQLVLTGAINDVGAFIRANSGKSRRIGVEAQWNWNIMKQLSWSGNITYSKSKNLDYYVEKEGKLVNLGRTPISFSPDVVAFQQLCLKPIKTLEISWQTKHVGDQHLDNKNNPKAKLDAYFVHNIFVQYTPFNHHKRLKTLELKALFNNITNKAYVNKGYLAGNMRYFFPQARFNWMLGASYTF